MRKRVFISYSHKDSKWLKRLQVFLEPYEREGVLERWDDTRIDPGGKWREKIKEAIESSSAAVLLISADFLASDFISKNELPPILAAAEGNGLVILPVIISPSRFERTPLLSQFHTINPPSTPLIKMPKWEREQLLDKVAEAVETAISRTDATITNKLALTPEGKAKNSQVSISGRKVTKKRQTAPLKARKNYAKQSPSRSVTPDDAVEYDAAYKFDRTGKQSDAALLNGALLYRLTSVMHSSKESILNGEGSLYGEGRFNYIRQRSAYCANNILVSISEVLFNMYSQIAWRIAEEQSLSLIAASLQSEMHLVVFRVRNIPNLVYSEAADVPSKYGVHLSKTTLIQPDHFPEPLRKFSARVRMQNKRGIICPSARHAKGHVLVFFQDESAKVQADSYVRLGVKLQLIAEDQDLNRVPELVNPFEQAIHPTMGYYSFTDKREYESLRSFGAIIPKAAPVCGFVDFIRRSYENYPHDAVRRPRPTQA